MTDKDTIPATPIAPLITQLFYQSEPTIDLEPLKEAVKRHCGGIDPASSCGAGASLAHFFMDEGVVEFKEGKLKSQLCLSKAQSLPESSRLEPALGQTWNWPDARQSLSCCQHMLIAHDLMAGPLDRHRRSQLFLGFVRAVVEICPPQAVHFMNSQLFVEPVRFLDQQVGASSEKMQSMVNVRLFRIEGKDGECLMDTLGLAGMGLPDVQCHFKSLDCGAIANKLYDVGMYLFEKGDVIKDGETVPGLSDNTKWRCQHEMALVGPERVVLDLSPEASFAAGGRQ